MNRLDRAADRRFLVDTARRFYRRYGDVFRALPLTLNQAARTA